MTTNKPMFPLTSMERVLKSIRPEMRVSDKSKVVFEKRLREYAEKLGQKAIDLAKHAGRRTVKDRDIESAQKTLIKS